jgi:RNA polymerase sigma factor (sigma-70 family)
LIDVEELGGTAERTRQAAELRVSEVYAREHSRLAALGAMITGDAAAGEDLAHDVFLHALRRCHEDPDYLREPAWPWLRLALVRRAMRRGERMAGELRRLALLHRSTAPQAWSGDTVDCVRALGELPPRMRACAVLFYWQDLSTADVASALGLSERTVENQLRRARAKLADRLRVAVPGKEA